MLAIVFPGQGSQSVGMLSELATQYPLVQETFAQASEALGYDLWVLTQHGPEEKLNSTQHTQPALLAAGVAVWRVWQEKSGKTPSFLAGHSLGEYTALVCAGALDFKTAVKLVEQRGEFMQQAVPSGTGAMAAIIGLEEAPLTAVCAQAAEGQVVQPANFNSPGQIVIAGQREAVERAIVLAKTSGAKLAINLPVSVPSHCELMRPAAERLAVVLQSIHFNAPKIPVVNNVDVAMPTDVEEIKAALVKQLYSPVRWTETINFLATQGVTTFIECGPGKVLLGLNKRIEKSLQHLAIYDPASLNAAL